ncbi:unnamed protein product [Rhizoctonia solani]|uniref:Endonuclease 3 n=1 Tax=Rhizoctonia solani TaxID=456999 RepID=A0A8H3BY85_9AGAM|nr:unnamed protein product [Rhizoctonia solani]
MRPLSLATFAAVLTSPAWGHEIVATIAQIYLLPSARDAICSIIPSEYDCSLAKVATWPDQVRKDTRWKWSADLHFVNGIDDDPPTKCDFGSKGWESKGNILQGIVDMTRKLESTNQDYALRFLTHFLGDIHQPLHLTGRYQGGNYVPVLFNGKETSLHKAWDDDLIPEIMKFLKDYKEPLPTVPSPALPAPILERNKKIELALTGSKYDPLVRWIVLEGISARWAGEVENWTSCPLPLVGSNIDQEIIQLPRPPPFQDPIDLHVCPYHWASESHKMLCNFVWRSDMKGVERVKDAVYEIELNTPEYAGSIRNRKVVEKQLTMGGLRLAHALNTILGSDKEKRSLGVLPRAL